jgi:hypothetical protein
MEVCLDTERKTLTITPSPISDCIIYKWFLTLNVHCDTSSKYPTGPPGQVSRYNIKPYMTLMIWTIMCCIPNKSISASVRCLSRKHAPPCSSPVTSLLLRTSYGSLDKWTVGTTASISCLRTSTTRNLVPRSISTLCSRSVVNRSYRTRSPPV